jgi:hypothetical protein
MMLDLIEKVTLYLSPPSNSSVFVYPNTTIKHLFKDGSDFNNGHLVTCFYSSSSIM